MATFQTCRAVNQSSIRRPDPDHPVPHGPEPLAGRAERRWRSGQRRDRFRSVYNQLTVADGDTRCGL
jgi:hypothetical protein